MDDNDLAVRVTGLQKRYGAKRAVDGLDLTVARGEIVAVLGPNGAGKTTTVEILEGYRRRDGGDVRVLGQDPQTAGRDWRARIGIVLQSSNDLAEATVSELVHHFARYYPDPRDPEEVIDAVGLREKVRTRTRQLSGGQRRRLDVALGIVGRPELLFLDEPTTGFDPEARHAFWDLIAGLRDGGTTIVLTTHYLEEAEHLADRVAVVRAGHVVAVDTPADLGGRSARRAVVQWTEGGEVRREQTDAPTAVVAALGARLGGEVPGLQVVRPTLEDVYLGLIADDEDTTPAGEPALATTEAAR
ncbi:ABC transporter ATP-binding protein [Cellulomonas hominis]|jgi:ABC-2 type transport system ATP-binding protein|uniref:ABC transporter n=1 Tax=Cellulomonas hominis TaxID=156981 RepID=A0A511FHD3_9CELL|nr:ABC transporter ATP-binding protein [Cellulomonas hominis]MBB5472325.1 ABC-2 type transport system ATP-binding protein [Cellulomonas hominis]MBU5422068.1 ABC transporter ATP-binding protein [Cellulomonas hominis]NKY07193.1 ABC transporter ATP-binding protein [Cellulomonas hominis]NKY10796.1 ABC transporter ATP-binding protein [Cellulomonas hominis]GEL47984.1 ABC transporter [Cellulomonas hominis]